MFLTKVVEKIKTHILCSIPFYIFFFPENRAVYEIMWKNLVQRDRPQMTIWRMRIACCVPKATNTLRICNTYYFSTAKIITRTRLNATLSVRCRTCCGLYQQSSMQTTQFLQLGHDHFLSFYSQFIIH